MTSIGQEGGRSHGSFTPAPVRGSDVALALLLASASTVYLATLPLNVIAPPDEAHALHQAKRLLDGEVLYRDLFDLVTPLWTYLMACLFWLFGTTLATARTAAAVIHGATALAVFLLCRSIGVRRAVAAVAAAAPVIVCEPAYPVANRHWLVTLMCLALLFWCLPVRRRPVWSFAAGIIAGTIVATHQQRGVSMGLGVLTFMLVEALLHARHGDTEPFAALASRVVSFAAGVVGVVGPTLAALMVTAGIEPVWYALVIHPLTNYYGTLSSSWARAGPNVAQSTYPLLLKYLPLILLPAAARLLLLIWRGRDSGQARLLALLALFCIFAVVSIAYYPDLVHVAFIAPLFFVAMAEAAEWLLRFLPRWAAATAAWVVAAVILATGGSRLAHRWNQEQSRYKEARATAFGRVDFTPGFARLYDELDRLLSSGPSRTLYAHPLSGFTYLILGARNPTRFEFMQAGSYNTDEQCREVLKALETEDVPYVFFPLPGLSRTSDPIVRFIHERYAPVEGSGSGNSIWKRRPPGTVERGEGVQPGRQNRPSAGLADHSHQGLSRHPA